MLSSVARRVYVEVPSHRGWGPRQASHWHLSQLWRLVRSERDVTNETSCDDEGCRILAVLLSSPGVGVPAWTTGQDSEAFQGGLSESAMLMLVQQMLQQTETTDVPALLTPTSDVLFASKRQNMILVVDASPFARMARKGVVPLARLGPALGKVLDATAHTAAAAPLQGGVQVCWSLVVSFRDTGDEHDALWCPLSGQRLHLGESTATARRRLDEALSAVEARLANLAAAAESKQHACVDSDKPTTIERCARAGLFALRFLPVDATSSVLVATDGNGIAPPFCALRRDGIATAFRRDGVALHVLDYAGDITPVCLSVDEEGFLAICGEYDEKRVTSSSYSASSAVCWGYCPDWASIALLCERAGGCLLSYRADRDALALATRSSSGDPHVAVPWQNSVNTSRFDDPGFVRFHSPSTQTLSSPGSPVRQRAMLDFSDHSKSASSRRDGSPLRPVSVVRHPVATTPQTFSRSDGDEWLLATFWRDAEEECARRLLWRRSPLSSVRRGSTPFGSPGLAAFHSSPGPKPVSRNPSPRLETRALSGKSNASAMVEMMPPRKAQAAPDFSEDSSGSPTRRRVAPRKQAVRRSNSKGHLHYPDATGSDFRHHHRLSPSSSSARGHRRLGSGAVGIPIDRRPDDKPSFISGRAVFVEQLAAYPLNNVDLQDVVATRATSDMDLTLLQFAMPKPNRHHLSRDPVVLEWQLSPLCQDDAVLRYHLEYRLPPRSELIAEIHRRNLFGTPAQQAAAEANYMTHNTQGHTYRDRGRTLRNTRQHAAAVQAQQRGEAKTQLSVTEPIFSNSNQEASLKPDNVDLAAAATMARGGTISVRIEVVASVMMVHELRELLRLRPLPNFGMAAVGWSLCNSLEGRSAQTDPATWEHDDDEEEGADVNYLIRDGGQSRGASEVQGNIDTGGTFSQEAIYLREHAASLLREDGRLAAVLQLTQQQPQHRQDFLSHITLGKYVCSKPAWKTFADTSIPLGVFVRGDAARVRFENEVCADWGAPLVADAFSRRGGCYVKRMTRPHRQYQNNFVAVLSVRWRSPTLAYARVAVICLRKENDGTFLADALAGRLRERLECAGLFCILHCGSTFIEFAPTGTIGTTRQVTLMNDETATCSEAIVGAECAQHWLRTSSARLSFQPLLAATTPADLVFRAAIANRVAAGFREIWVQNKEEGCDSMRAAFFAEEGDVLNESESAHPSRLLHCEIQVTVNATEPHADELPTSSLSCNLWIQPGCSICIARRLNKLRSQLWDADASLVGALDAYYTLVARPPQCEKRVSAELCRNLAWLADRAGRQTTFNAPVFTEEPEENDALLMVVEGALDANAQICVYATQSDASPTFWCSFDFDGDTAPSSSSSLVVVRVELRDDVLITSAFEANPIDILSLNVSSPRPEEIISAVGRALLSATARVHASAYAKSVLSLARTKPVEAKLIEQAVAYCEWNTVSETLDTVELPHGVSDNVARGVATTLQDDVKRAWHDSGFELPVTSSAVRARTRDPPFFVRLGYASEGDIASESTPPERRLITLDATTSKLVILKGTPSTGLEQVVHNASQQPGSSSQAQVVEKPPGLRRMLSCSSMVSNVPAEAEGQQPPASSEITLLSHHLEDVAASVDAASDLLRVRLGASLGRARLQLLLAAEREPLTNADIVAASAACFSVGAAAKWLDTVGDSAQTSVENFECRVDVVAIADDDDNTLLWTFGRALQERRSWRSSAVSRRVPPTFSSERAKILYKQQLRRRGEIIDEAADNEQPSDDHLRAMVDDMLSRIAFRAVDASSSAPRYVVVRADGERTRLHWVALSLRRVNKRVDESSAARRGRAGQQKVKPSYLADSPKKPTWRRQQLIENAGRPFSSGPIDKTREHERRMLNKRIVPVSLTACGTLFTFRHEKNDEQKKAIVKSVNTALSGASLVASQLRLLSDLAASKCAREVLIPIGGDGAADIGVSPLSCEQLGVVPLKCPHRFKQGATGVVDAVIERIDAVRTKMRGSRLNTTLRLRANKTLQFSDLAEPVENREKVFVCRAPPTEDSVPTDSSAATSLRECCYARLWTSDDNRSLELRIFGVRIFSDAAVAAAAAAIQLEFDRALLAELLNDFFENFSGEHDMPSASAQHAATTVDIPRATSRLGWKRPAAIGARRVRSAWRSSQRRRSLPNAGPRRGTSLPQRATPMNLDTADLEFLARQTEVSRIFLVSDESRLSAEPSLAETVPDATLRQLAARTVLESLLFVSWGANGDDCDSGRFYVARRAAFVREEDCDRLYQPWESFAADDQLRSVEEPFWRGGNPSESFWLVATHTDLNEHSASISNRSSTSLRQEYEYSESPFVALAEVRVAVVANGEEREHCSALRCRRIAALCRWSSSGEKVSFDAWLRRRIKAGLEEYKARLLTESILGELRGSDGHSVTSSSLPAGLCSTGDHFEPLDKAHLARSAQHQLGESFTEADLDCSAEASNMDGSCMATSRQPRHDQRESAIGEDVRLSLSVPPQHWCNAPQGEETLSLKDISPPVTTKASSAASCSQHTGSEGGELANATDSIASFGGTSYRNKARRMHTEAQVGETHRVANYVHAF